MNALTIRISILGQINTLQQGPPISITSILQLSFIIIGKSLLVIPSPLLENIRRHLHRPRADHWHIQ
jgi:hypothetical protein